MLAIASEDYFYKNKFDVAYTFIKNNGLEEVLEKIESNAWLK